MSETAHNHRIDCELGGLCASHKLEIGEYFGWQFLCSYRGECEACGHSLEQCETRAHSFTMVLERGTDRRRFSRAKP